MLVATWNVNSVRARLPRLLPWLARRRPDVVCLQETKVVNEAFPLAEMRELGYTCTVYGQKTYNGVAILSRTAPTEIIFGLPEDGVDSERRLVAATVDDTRFVSVYVPNGKEVGHPAYRFKLEWLARLKDWLDAIAGVRSNIVVAGDFNVAPDDRDVWNVDLWRGLNLFSEPEKAAFRSLLDWGLVDTVRFHNPEEGVYTWWDYRQGAFHRGWGLRIDHVLASRAMSERCVSATVERDERKGEGPSDHAPVVVEFADR